MISPQRWPWAVLLVLSACTNPAEPSAPASPERYAVELASAYCAYGVRCESPADAQRFSAFCHPAAVEQRLADLLERQPHLTYDPEAAAACLQTIEDATEGCAVPFCEPVLIGTLAAGDACDEDRQCGPGLSCTRREERARCSGVCAYAGGEGTRCREDRECADGLHCHEGDCTVDRVAGERCRRSSECATGLLCDRERAECYPPSDAEGRSCGDPGDSAGDGADDDDEEEEEEEEEEDEGEDERGADRCPVPTDCVDGVCQRHEPGLVAGPGEPCAPGECAASHFCDAGTCAPRPGLTEPCGGAARCVEGRCVGGTCRLLPPRSSCVVDRECATDRCTMGSCAVPSAVGAPCDRDRDCANGLQCSGRSCVVRGPCG